MNRLVLSPRAKAQAFVMRCEWQKCTYLTDCWGRHTWKLRTPRGRVAAEVYGSLCWHTWDRNGVGGENGGDERSVETAKGEVMRAMVRQIMRDPSRWHATERRKNGAEWMRARRARR